MKQLLATCLLAWAFFGLGPASAQGQPDEPAAEEPEEPEEPAAEEPAAEEPAAEEPAAEAPADAGAPAEGEAGAPAEGNAGVPAEGDGGAAAEGEGDEAPAEGEAKADETPGEFPEEVLALFPQAVLDALPKVMTRFLRLKDYEALRAACPQTELEAIGTCFETEAAQDVFGEQFGRAVVSTLTGYMDAELPNRLSEDDLDHIAEPCEKPGEAWGECIVNALDKGTDPEEVCDDAEDALAACVVAHDRVGEAFLAVQQERKQVFGPDVYVDYRGLLSVLTLEQVKAVRAACPQTEHDALTTCLDDNEVVGTLVDEFQKLAAAMAAEARTELAAAGKPLTDEQAEAFENRVADLFYRFPLRVIGDVADACSKKYPELDTLDDPAKLDKSLECLENEAEVNAIANPAYISKERLLGWLGQGKEKVIGKIREKELAGQAKAFNRMLAILAGLALAGFLFIILRPLALRVKDAAQKKVVWKASGFAALTFLLTVASLSVTLLVMRTVQGAVMVDSTSPKMRIASAVFTVLQKDHQVELFSDLSRERLDFIKTPLQAVLKGAGDASQHENFAAFVAEHWTVVAQEPELKNVAKNVVMLKQHADEMKTMLGFFRKVDWIMGYVPIVLALLAVLLYLLPMKDTLVEIVNAPIRAIDGRDPNAVAKAMHTIKGEFKLIGPYLIAMLLFLPLVGVFIALAVEPIVELLLGYLIQTVWYILGSEASALVLDLSLGGVILLLAFAMVIFILAMGQFLGTVRKVLRARFHWGHPFARYSRFLKFGLPASLAVLAFPVLYAYGVHYVAYEIIDPKINFDALTTTDMLGMPVAGLLAFPVLFWALRGFKLMKFVGKYPVVQDAPAAPATTRA